MQVIFSMRVYGKEIGPPNSGKYAELGPKEISGLKMRGNGKKFQEKKITCVKCLGSSK